jgi:hypothetical protein
MSTRTTTVVAVVVTAALIAVGLAAAIGRGTGAEAVSATFEARAIGDPSIKSCPSIGGTFGQFEASYQGSFTTNTGEELALTLRRLEILVDRETGLGAAEGTWQLQAPPEPEVVGSGELTAVFIGDPNLIGDPNVFGGKLHGMLLGGFEDPDERRAIWNFSASVRDGSVLTGAIGDPHIAPNPAVLIPPGPCTERTG